MHEPIKIEIGAGELLDKITILQIKSERMTDAAKLENVRHELAMLCQVQQEKLSASPQLDRLMADLKAVNEALWVIEDDIRACEARQDFGDDFIRLARAVYITNDKRAKLKKDINELTGARIIEEKSYYHGQD